ncbi:PREDICTED: STE20-like serine/threonine-protein kinase isoform X1 [Branchiostoma belcheri]|uniref:STE20-like serine/threonine-protein kinase isoform X1 n=1 Tax=Branchiostoma belcheri TaxID=7741 RepID=A0A6P5AG94_BRABE|nr:PREDICTED: STE20-like serine/threonine-protein kinase isoform X1 [Branchiostoma belcheri]
MPSVRSKEEFYKDNVLGSVQSDPSGDVEQPWALTQRGFDTSCESITAETMQQVPTEERDVLVAHHADHGSTADESAEEISSTESSEAEENVQPPDVEVSSSPAEQKMQDHDLMNAAEPKSGKPKKEESVTAEEMEEYEANESAIHPVSSEEPNVGGTKEGENGSADESENDDAESESTNSSASTDDFKTDEEKEEESAISYGLEDGEQAESAIHLTTTEDGESILCLHVTNITKIDTGTDRDQSEQGEKQAKREIAKLEGQVEHTDAPQEEREGKQGDNTEDRPGEENVNESDELDNILEGLLRDTAIVEDDKVATAPQKTLLVEANGRQDAAERREDGVKDRQERAAQQAEMRVVNLLKRQLNLPQKLPQNQLKLLLNQLKLPLNQLKLPLNQLKLPLNRLKLLLNRLKLPQRKHQLQKNPSQRKHLLRRRPQLKSLLQRHLQQMHLQKKHLHLQKMHLQKMHLQKKHPHLRKQVKQRSLQNLQRRLLRLRKKHLQLKSLQQKHLQQKHLQKKQLKPHQRTNQQKPPRKNPQTLLLLNKALSKQFDWLLLNTTSTCPSRRFHLCVRERGAGLNRAHTSKHRHHVQYSFDIFNMLNISKTFVLTGK